MTSEVEKWIRAYIYLSTYITGFFNGYGISDHKFEKLGEAIEDFSPEWLDPKKVYNYCHFCGERRDGIPLPDIALVIKCLKCGQVYKIMRKR